MSTGTKCKGKCTQNYCYFVVWTNNWCVVIEIKKDPSQGENLTRLREFYFKHLFPKIVWGELQVVALLQGLKLAGSLYFTQYTVLLSSIAVHLLTHTFSMLTVESLWPRGRALEHGIQRSEVQFLTRTQNFFVVPRS